MTTHEHIWTTSSRHDTSEGRISYQNCACGAQRIVAPAHKERAQLAVVLP